MSSPSAPRSKKRQRRGDDEEMEELTQQIANLSSPTRDVPKSERRRISKKALAAEGAEVAPAASLPSETQTEEVFLSLFRLPCDSPANHLGLAHHVEWYSLPTRRHHGLHGFRSAFLLAL